MDRRPPVLALSALGNRPPVQNWNEEERDSVVSTPRSRAFGARKSASGIKLE